MNFGTRAGAGIEQVKQEFPNFNTRFPAKFCSPERLRMSGENSKKHVNLTSFICFLPPNFPSLMDSPPSLIRTRVPFGPSHYTLTN